MKTTQEMLNDIVAGMTLSQTENESLKKQWEQLKVVSQLTEKEMFIKNIDTVQGLVDEYSNLNARVKQLEMYLGALKNQFEEFRTDQNIKDKKFEDYITEEFKNDQSKD